MNARTPIPLTADPGTLIADQRRSLGRALAALALGAITSRTPFEMLKRSWPGDNGTELVLRAIVNPTSTADAGLRVDAVQFLISLAPASAAARLFEKAMRLSLCGNPSNQYRRSRGRAAAGFVTMTGAAGHRRES